MPKETWIIDGDNRPLKRKLQEVDKAAAKSGDAVSNIGGKKGGGGGLGGLLGGGLGKAAGLAGLAAGAGLAIGGLAKLGGQLETSRIQFGTFLGSVERGNALLNDLTEFANFTPFTNEKIEQAGKTLLSFGFSGEEVVGTLKTLGDISAGTGKDLSELSVIFGQIRSTGKLMGGDLLQLINAGFNPLQEISRTTGRSVLDLKDDMSKGLISFEQVEEAFKSATSEGGLFNGMTEKLSNSFEGKLSTALGKGKALLQTVGEKILPIFNFALDGAIGLVDMLSRVSMQPLVDTFNTLYDSVSFIVEPLADLISSAFEGESGFNAFQAAVDGFALILRGTTLPVRALIKGVELLIESGNGIRETFGGLGDIIGGVFTLDAERIKKGILDTDKAYKNVKENIRSGFLEFGKAEAEATLGLVGNFGKERSSKASSLSDFASSSTGGLGGGGSSSSTAAGTKSSRSSTGSGLSGGADLKNFVINIESLVENMIFEKPLKMSETEIQSVVSRALLAAVNDTQRLA